MVFKENLYGHVIQSSHFKPTLSMRRKSHAMSPIVIPTHVIRRMRTRTFARMTHHFSLLLGGRFCFTPLCSEIGMTDGCVCIQQTVDRDTPFHTVLFLPTSHSRRFVRVNLTCKSGAVNNRCAKTTCFPFTAPPRVLADT